MSTNITDIFSSNAKTSVLQVLSAQDSALTLRSIEDLCNLHIRSVALAVRELMKAGILEILQEGNKTLCKLNKAHPLTAVIIEIFRIVTEHNLKNNSKKLGEKFQSSLSFISSTNLYFDELHKLRNKT